VNIKAGICVAYDWSYLELSLPSIYTIADSICLSVDADCKSWNGNIFPFDWDRFYQMIDSIDSEKKIQVLKEPFFDASRTPIENECYQRKRMADFLGNSDWVVQIDTDEIIINPKDFKALLAKYKHSQRAINIHGIWINLIKHTTSGYIYSVTKTPPLATNSPVYEYGRTNGHFSIYTNTFIGHITWARPEEEVYYKLKNWGHSHEFNGMSFFKIWQALDDENWKYIKDFHPMNKGSIPQLYFHKAVDVKSLIYAFDGRPHQLGPKEKLLNNIWFSRFQKVLKSLRPG
jgi:glycosyltransferase involved in cell wall biosynthesis